MTIKHLILGGARSGKSTFAEKLSLELHQQKSSNSQLLYIATATAGDSEMSRRISQHQTRRDAQWRTIEEPIELAETLLKCPVDATILVDCLTLWLSNCLHQNCWNSQKRKLLDIVAQIPTNIIFVSNEVGSGIVPMGELSRQFVDESGWIHQRLAEQCSDVSLIVAGLPLALKRNGQNCHS
jgi:adenosylcobinamide kinase/adenosylcobinamide-phosphate guanylyltransferase